jgi:hypothetical protein
MRYNSRIIKIWDSIFKVRFIQQKETYLIVYRINCLLNLIIMYPYSKFSIIIISVNNNLRCVNINIYLIIFSENFTMNNDECT